MACSLEFNPWDCIQVELEADLIRMPPEVLQFFVGLAVDAESPVDVSPALLIKNRKIVVLL